MNVRLAIPLICLATLLAACEPRAASERHERTNWYVEISGDDANICYEPSEPCRTLGEALDRADADDKIIIGAGTFNETGRDSSSFEGPFTIEANSLWIQGAGMGATIIDFGGASGMFVRGVGNYLLEDFTIQNGDPCLTIGEMISRDLDLPSVNHVTVDSVEVTNCQDGIFITGTGSTRLVTNVIASVNLRNGLVLNNDFQTVVEGGEYSNNGRDGIESSRSTLEVNNATIDRNGSPGSLGGTGILVQGGTVTITHSTITNNGYEGGPILSAVRADGMSLVSITDSLIDGNIQGPGTYNNSNLLIVDSTISNNWHEGVFLWNGEAHLDNVIVSNNCVRPASGVCSGGGITSLDDGILEIRNSHITGNGNALAAAIASLGRTQMTIIYSTIEDNVGGCMVSNEGEAIIDNSLIANNLLGDAPYTVAICNYGELSMSNSTVSGHLDGSAIETSRGELSLSFVTLTANDAGLVVHTGATVNRLLNVLIADNELDCIFNRDVSTSANQGTNIDSDNTCTGFRSHTVAEIALGALSDNGGPTLTHALLAGSLARDEASESCLDVDQRMVARPIGPGCDVGAYEAGVSATSLDSTATPEGSILIVEEDFPCYTGPGPQYTTLSTLKAGTQMQIVGYGFGGGWLVAFHPTLEGRHCWIDEDFVSFDVPIAELRLIAVPPKPTQTPSPIPDRQEEEPTACATTINYPKACD